MTEEEKKEFEEFLKWKEERAKKEENKPTEVESKSVDNQQSSVLVDNDKVEGNNNTGIILAFVAVAMLILVFVVFGFAEKKTPTLDETEIVVDSEIALLPGIFLIIVEPRQDLRDWILGCLDGHDL